MPHFCCISREVIATALVDAREVITIANKPAELRIVDQTSDSSSKFVQPQARDSKKVKLGDLEKQKRTKLSRRSNWQIIRGVYRENVRRRLAKLKGGCFD